VLTEAEQMKRKRGRPKGSKNKPKVLAQSYDTKEAKGIEEQAEGV
jgi:hypothetical protein